MLIAKTYRFRLDPNKQQNQLFYQFAGSCRFVFNQALSSRQLAYQEEQTNLTYADQCKQLTELKKAKATTWIARVHSQVLQQALKDLDAAYQNFFRRLKAGEASGAPKFKKRGKKDAFRYPQGVKIANSRVFLPKIGWVKYRDSRPIEGKLLQTTIKREGEHWFVCLACQIEMPDPTPTVVQEERAVGIDVGLKSFAVLSDGTAIDNPRFLQRGLIKLKREQRRLSRKVKRSNNWQRQMRKVVKLQIQIKNARKDFSHKLSSVIVKNHDVIAVENLNIHGLVQNRRLSRAISDAGWGHFLGMLEYKASWAGKHFVRVERFLPSSKMCSSCGRTQEMPLEVRTYRCAACGVSLDRDWNASLNIRSAGLAVLNACGGA